jgi:outer membrane protein assembly factor BamA
MTLRALSQLAVMACGLAFLNVPSSAQVSALAEIERIEFEGLNDVQQKTISMRLSVRAGDVLSVDARHRIAAELRTIGKDLAKTLTFSYKPGSKLGTAKLKISDGC